MNEISVPVQKRAVNLLLAVIASAAVVGYFVGIDHGAPQPSPVAPSATARTGATADTNAIPALRYSDVISGGLRAPRTYALDQLARPDQGLFAEPPLDPELKQASLRLRAQRRAYNGAPPVVPHDVDQLSSAACLACHGDGFKLENRTARQLPHPNYANCMQCHAPPPPSALSNEFQPTNTFEGVAAPFEGARAWPGAPPVVPHTTWMRDNCLSCHGPSGWPGMKTTHAWRQNCLQCHAPSAALELNPQALRELRFLPDPRKADE